MAAGNAFITGKQIVLRTLMDEDGPAVYKLFTDPETMSVDGGRTMGHIQEAYDFIRYYSSEAQTAIRLAVVDRYSHQFYGTAGFHKIDYFHNKAEIGGEIDRSVWGKRLGTESAQLLIAFGFEQLKLHRIEARILPTNSRALALVKQMGFEYEGRLKESEKWSNQYVDLLMFSMLNNKIH